jgi:hypothetical protein
MLLERIQAVVSASYSQYYVCDRDAEPEPDFTTGGTGVIDAVGDWAFVATGTQDGNIPLAVEVHDSQPSFGDEWDDVVDVGMTLPSCELIVLNWAAGPAVVARLAPSGTGVYRVRLHVRGRDDARYGDGSEEHLIAVWPGRAMGAVVWRAADDVGAYGRSVEPDEPVEFLTTPSVWYVPPWQSPPKDDAATRIAVDMPVVRSPSVDITLTAITVYATGCWFQLNSVGRDTTVDDDLGDALRTGFAGPDGMRVTLRSPSFPKVTSRPGQSRPDRGPEPDGPRFTGFLYAVQVTNRQVATEHRAWLWPLPPPHPWQLEVAWPAIGLAPTTIELDGAAIVGKR